MSTAGSVVDGRPSGADDEIPLWLPAGDAQVFAIASRPARPNGVGVVLIHSGVLTMTAHSGRIWTRTARYLAANGCWTLRIDLSGSGNSTGTFERRADGPALADAAAAIRELEGRGVHSVVLVGHCFGAVAALGAAVRSPSVRGVVLVAPPLTWITRGQTMLQAGGPAPVTEAARSVLSRQVLGRMLSDPSYRRWLARRVARRTRAVLRPPTAATADHGRLLVGLAELDQLTRSNTLVQVLYGEKDVLYADFQRATADGFGEIMGRPSAGLVVTPGYLHNLDSVAAQHTVRTAVEDVAAAVAGPAS